jgi:hypothetical protein
MQCIAGDRFARVELAESLRRRRRIAHHHLVVAGHDRAKLATDELLGKTASDHVVDGSLLILPPAPLALEPKPPPAAQVSDSTPLS